MSDPYVELADRFVEHYATLRGIVRFAIVARQLDAHFPPPPARIADIGGGAGHQAIRLAQKGYRVVLLDPSKAMLRKAQQALKGESPELRQRVELVEGYGEDAARVLGPQRFDAVLCHGVLMYLEDPAPLIGVLARITRPSGLVSVVAKNAEALALRPALQGRFRDALAVFDADRDVGGMGVVTRGDTVDRLAAVMRQEGVEPLAWYGIRVLTDHLLDLSPGPDLPEVLEAEWQAGRRDPYRRIGRLLHVLGRRL